ncbi:aromatic acid exporter family protein [Thalassiella azotivora]
MPDTRSGRQGVVASLPALLSRHPRWALALRVAVAAAIAWQVALLLPDPAGDYPYYAPLGAVVASSVSLAGSARESVQAVASIALGGLIAVASDALLDVPGPFIIAVVVGLGVMAAGWERLGPMASWVPTAALFTLVIGGGETFYVGVYAGLVLLGALVGLAITVVVPQLPLAPAQEAVDVVRTRLTDQLTELAEALAGDRPPDREEWQRRELRISPHLNRMRAAVAEAEQATRANVRARRYRSAFRALRAEATELDRVSGLVLDLVEVLAETERAGKDEVALGPALRPATCRALNAAAEVLGTVDAGVADGDAVTTARTRLAELTDQLDEQRSTEVRGGGTLVAGSVVTTLMRMLDRVDPRLGESTEPTSSEDGSTPA